MNKKKKGAHQLHLFYSAALFVIRVVQRACNTAAICIYIYKLFYFSDILRTDDGAPLFWAASGGTHTYTQPLTEYNKTREYIEKKRKERKKKKKALPQSQKKPTSLKTAGLGRNNQQQPNDIIILQVEFISVPLLRLLKENTPFLLLLLLPPIPPSPFFEQKKGMKKKEVEIEKNDNNNNRLYHRSDDDSAR